MQQRDSLGYTLMVATVLCVVCSLAVSRRSGGAAAQAGGQREAGPAEEHSGCDRFGNRRIWHPGQPVGQSADQRTESNGSARSWSIWKLASTPATSISITTT